MAQVDAGGVAAAAEPPVQNYQAVIDLFPQLDLEATLRQFPHMNLDALVEYILVNEATIPKKQRGQKRAHDEPAHKPADESADAADLSADNEDLDAEDELLVSVMVKDMLNHLHRELQGAIAAQGRNELAVLVQWLKITFRGAKVSFINRIPRPFKYHAVSCGIACFLAENNFGYRLQIHAPEISQRFWMNDAQAMKIKRRVSPPELEQVAARRPIGADKFDELMAAMKTKYPQLFAGDQLSPDARHLKAQKEEKKTDEEKMDCIVCFETYAVSKMLCCNPPTAGRTPSPDPNAPCSSAAAAEAAKDETVHTFCRGCLRQHAKAACEDMPMADGGVGLKCLEHGCKNPVLFSEIRHLLQKEVRKRLDERVLEENLGLAGFSNLERCRRCNFAMVIDVPKEVDKVFSCQNPNCEYQFCRLCEQPWGDDHFGVSCEQLGSVSDKEQRELEKKLTEIVLRKCPKCGLTFLKETGCNKMTCRCGVKQCYVCKASPIEYDHFCSHLRDPLSQQTKCTKCNKTCLLWEDASKKDEEKIREVLNGREEPLKDVPTASAAIEHLAAAQMRRQAAQVPVPNPRPGARNPNPFAFNVPAGNAMPRVAQPARAIPRPAAQLLAEHHAAAQMPRQAPQVPGPRQYPFMFNVHAPNAVPRFAQPAVPVPRPANVRAPEVGANRDAAARGGPAPDFNFVLQRLNEARNAAAAPRH
ncbi:hypothetical protein AAVH_31764 [Aphelenchoides avenae]|nr:hypothetical protein AAVH_31764 [Aphelenchus avenae]